MHLEIQRKVKNHLAIYIGQMILANFHLEQIKIYNYWHNAINSQRLLIVNKLSLYSNIHLLTHFSFQSSFAGLSNFWCPEEKIRPGMGNSMFIYQHRGRSMGLEGKYYGLCPPLGTEPELQDFKLAITFEEEFCCCCSVANMCPTLCDPMDCSMPGSNSCPLSQSCHPTI